MQTTTFPRISRCGSLPTIKSPSFSQDAGGKVCCQSIFIFSSFGRSFIGLSAQGDISDPDSESMRLHIPSSSFLFLFLSLSNILAQNPMHKLLRGVAPGQMRDQEGMLRVSGTHPVPPRNSFSFKSPEDELLNNVHILAKSVKLRHEGQRGWLHLEVKS